MSVKGFHIGGQTQQYNYPNLDNTPTIPSKTSDLTNDSGFVTEDALSAVESAIDGVGADQDYGYLASVDKKYLTSANAESTSNLLSHTDYVRIPDNAIGITVRGYTAGASGSPTYSVNPSILFYDANKVFLGYFGTTDKSSEKTFSIESYPAAVYVRINQPGGNSPISKMIRWNYADKEYFGAYANGFVGRFTGAFTASQQTLNTGIKLKAGTTYCIKVHGTRESSFNIYGVGNTSNYKRIRPYFNELYFVNDSAERELAAFNGDATSFDSVDLEVFEVDSVQAKAESIPKTYRVDSFNPTAADYTSISKCLIDLKDDDSPKIIEIWGGDYNIFAEYTELYNAGLLEKYTGNDPSMDYFPYCVWVPPNTHIIGKGIVRLRWEPDPATDDITPNQCKTISPLNVAGSATIENVEVYCKNGRYCLHNDALGKAQFTGAVQRYINCRFYKYGNDTDAVSGSTYGFLATTGFGVDNSMRHVYENCVFVNYANNRAFYGHSRTGVISYEKNNSDITLTNCVFVSGGSPCIKLGNASSNRQIHIRTMFNGCSIQGLIRSGLEGSETSNCANGFDIQFLNCGNVTLQINDPDNEYPPQAYNTQLTVAT